MRHVVREIAGTRDLLALAAAWPRRYPGLLESAARGGARASQDILFAFPGRRLALDADGVLDLDGRRFAGDFLQELDREWRAQAAVPGGDADADVPFRGGWLLYLGYELAAQVEPTLRLPRAPERMPVALALRCPAAIVVDHARARTLLVAEAGREDLVAAMAADLERAPPPPAGGVDAVDVAEDDPAPFLDGVARVHAHLRAGDVFQVNLSRGWQARVDAATVPADVYAALRRANPAPFAGLLQHGDWAVASSSPERLLEVRGRLAQTRPIAGTRARVAGDDDDARRRELVAHPKERAEHVMLIDLERNDLGRVCEPGSIVVDELMALESYAHVHHIVSNLRGRLRAGVTPGEAIRAVFPGGTITGCPKVRCMQIIAALERVGRGAYTGALGYLCGDGDLDLNILIRTLTLQDGVARFRAGAGIVADSLAERELDETRAKARGVLRALAPRS